MWVSKWELASNTSGRYRNCRSANRVTRCHWVELSVHAIFVFKSTTEGFGNCLGSALRSADFAAQHALFRRGFFGHVTLFTRNGRFGPCKGAGTCKFQKLSCACRYVVGMVNCCSRSEVFWDSGAGANLVPIQTVLLVNFAHNHFTIRNCPAKKYYINNWLRVLLCNGRDLIA